MLPLETVIAVFPNAARGEKSLRPLTLAHATVLEALGVRTDKDIPPESALLAAVVMSRDAGEVGALMSGGDEAVAEIRRDAKMIADEGETLERLTERVNAVLDAAFLTFVPSGAAVEVTRTVFRPTGYGWPLEYADVVCHEYGWPWEYAMTMPLSRLFGLVVCARQRNGGEAGGPDYFERIQIKEDVKKVKEALARAKAAEEEKKTKEKEARDGGQ